ncbi:MAG: hypothetical protein U0529_05380 [Thermoanaerobaculia bacterium]
MSKRLIVRVLLVSLAPFALDGCVSVGLSRSVREGAPSGTGEVGVAIYQKASDRDSGSPVAYPVLSELIRVDGASRTVVARSMAGTWTIGELAAGRYVLRTAKKIDDNGNVVPLSGPVEKEFALAAGERVEAKVVLEQVPVLLIVLAVITVVILVLVLLNATKSSKSKGKGHDHGHGDGHGDGHAGGGSHDHGHSHLPPPPPAPPVFVHVAIEIPISHASGTPAVEPGVADVFPAPGSVVAARRVNVSFLMTTPVDAGGIGKDAVLAVGTRSGEIPGTVQWRPDDRFLVFVPSQDFSGGETVTVTLDLEKVRSDGGRSGKGLVSTSFQVP